MSDLSLISANAITPDQILSYVSAVSGLKVTALEGCAFHYGAGHGVLVAYPWQNPLAHDLAEKAITKALAFPGLENLTVIGAARPACAPGEAISEEDSYWFMDLPATPPAGKLANMLSRASREVRVTAEPWTPGHGELVDNFCKRKILSESTRYLFAQLDKYAAACRDAEIFSARRSDGSLAAFAIADFSALATAFYMFAFRAPDAPPGTSDLLLKAIVDEAASRGHSRLNLGLGINPGICFFKRKWGATPYLPFVETTWQIKKSPAGFFRRLFGG